MLTAHLRELESDALILREVTGLPPAPVYYSLTRRGEDLRDVVLALEAWGTRLGSTTIAVGQSRPLKSRATSKGGWARMGGLGHSRRVTSELPSPFTRRCLVGS